MRSLSLGMRVDTLSLRAVRFCAPTATVPPAGFSASVRDAGGTPPVPAHLRPLLTECGALYELLRAQPGLVRPSSGQVGGGWAAV